jgi:hypothetical protein
MANSDKNIVITPNIGQTTDPTIVFSGANSTLAAQNITLTTLPDSNGTLSFSGTAGQLLSITNSLTGTIFSVNDVSGIPIIEVFANSTIRMTQYGGNVEIYGNLITPNLNVVLNDISNQFDNVTSVFSLKNNQSNVTNIVNSKDVSVTVGGQTLAPYVTQLTWPWFVDYDSWRGFRIKSDSVSSNVIIYNSPAIGDQSSIIITDNSSTIQTRRYPFAPETIALGDE